MELRQTFIRQRLRAVRAFVQTHLHDGSAGVVLRWYYAKTSYENRHRRGRCSPRQSWYRRDEACAVCWGRASASGREGASRGGRGEAWRSEGVTSRRGSRPGERTRWLAHAEHAARSALTRKLLTRSNATHRVLHELLQYGRALRVVEQNLPKTCGQVHLLTEVIPRFRRVIRLRHRAPRRDANLRANATLGSFSMVERTEHRTRPHTRARFFRLVKIVVAGRGPGRRHAAEPRAPGTTRAPLRERTRKLRDDRGSLRRRPPGDPSPRRSG